MEKVEEQFATLCAKRYAIKGAVNPIAPPIYATSTYLLQNAEHGALLCSQLPPKDGQSPYLYSRWGNPTVDLTAEAINALEGGNGCLVLSSGMAAITTALLTFLKTGDHIVAPNPVYGGTHEAIRDILTKFHVECDFVDGTDVSAYEKAIKKNTKVLYGETPANPTMSIVDLEALANLATKYLGGHSDVTAGAIISRSKEHHTQLYETCRLFGNSLSPFDSFLLLRGIKSLDVRMERHNSNAQKIAEFLEGHPKVEKVYYPGLASHPQHEVAKKQMKGFGGMIAFEVKGGIEAGKKVIESVKLINLAVSLGGADSLIEHAASMTHTMVDREERLKGGISDGLIRFSVGIEHVDDLIADLSQALSSL